MTSPDGLPRRIIPRRLGKDDMITVFSPSSSVPSFFQERLDRAEQNLRSLGFQVRRGMHAVDRTGYTAGMAEQRAAELNDAFRDPDVHCIHCSIGGNNSNQILDLLDYDAIRKNPKILLGYSDSTALLNAVWQVTGLVVYHGPGVLPEFGEFPTALAYTRESLTEILSEPRRATRYLAPKSWTDEYAEWADPQNAGRVRAMNRNASWSPIASGSGKGPLVGGNLETLLKLAGTRFWPDLNGAIFFWEEARQSVALIDSHLVQLEQMGVFDMIAGMVIGRPYHCDESVGVDFRQLVEAWFASAHYPVLADVDLGHTDPMITLPIGINARLRVGRSGFDFSLLERPVA